MKVDRMLFLQLLCAVLFVGIPAISFGVPIHPVSYDMPNGSGQARGGEYNYWDGIYSGSGDRTVDGAYLSGGLGKLTDGVIATKSWEYPDTSDGFNYGTRENFEGTGPYVGWTWEDPTIVFHFAPTTITAITFYMDDPVDNHGGVAAPVSFTINGTLYPVFNPTPRQGPLALTFADLGLTGVDTLAVTINRDQSPGLYWAFASEVTFDDGAPLPVPEPATFVLLGSGLAALAIGRKRRRA